MTHNPMSRPPAIKKRTIASLKKDLTPEQRDFMKLIRPGRLDPVFFATELLDVRLHDAQKLWLWMTTKTQLEKAFELGVITGHWKDRAAFAALRALNPDMLRNILVPSNRWGKTLVTSVKHLWYNFYKIGVKGDWENVKEKNCGTLNLSPHSAQCDAGFQYIIDILSSSFVYMFEGKSFKNKCKVEWFFEGEEKVKRKIRFSNNTSYRAVPTGEDQASSLAGTPYLYISYDECAQSLHLKNELPAKIMSRLIDFGGPLDLVSTPEVDKPSHQYFYHIAKLGLAGEEGWWTMIGKITDNTFLSPSERDQTIASIKATDPAKYRQVAYGEFITTGKKMFDTLVIERLWASFGASPLPQHDHRYMISADWGFADNGDPTVFYVLDITRAMDDAMQGRKPRYDIVYRESIRGGSPFAVFAHLKMLRREWNGAETIHDASSLGGTLIKKLLREMDVHDLIDFSASGNKADMLFTMLIVMTDGRVTEVDAEGKVIDKNADFGRVRGYYIPELEEQLGNYAYNPDKGVTDKKLEQDDVMALGQALWHLEKKYNKRHGGKLVTFNPLANDVKNIFPEQTVRALEIKNVTIPEKVIL